MPKEFDVLRKAIKKQLKKDNPDLDEDELESKSFAVATSQWKKTHGGKGPSEEVDNSKLKLDEDGHIIIAENCKLYIQGNITSITE